MKVTADDVQYFGGREHAVHLPHRIPKAKWTHVAIVKDGPTLTCYTSGKEVASAAANFDMPSLPLYAGGDPFARELCPCRLDEVRLYAAALSVLAVQRLSRHDASGRTPLLRHSLDGD